MDVTWILRLAYESVLSLRKVLTAVTSTQQTVSTVLELYPDLVRCDVPRTQCLAAGGRERWPLRTNSLDTYVTRSEWRHFRGLISHITRLLQIYRHQTRLYIRTSFLLQLIDLRLPGLFFTSLFLNSHYQNPFKQTASSKLIINLRII